MMDTDYGLEDSDSNPEEASPTRRRITEEVRAQYTNYLPTIITILHFNDVYNIEERKQEPVGGAARFATVIKSFEEDKPLVFFSGDALNPSIMSSVTRGQQMLPVLNVMGINTAVFGNHDFDFGVDELQDFTRESNFPWMLSNVIDNLTGEPLADGLVTRMITYKEKKIGLIGLVEEEWLVTLTTIDRENLTYIDYVEQGQKLAKQLKQQGADLVIALTHMRMPNDIRLAENVEDIDLILGGHDHDYDLQQVKSRYIVKSGTDFRTLSKLRIEIGCYGNDVQIDKLEVTSDVDEDSHVRDIVEQFKEKVNKEMEGTLGFIEVDLEARFFVIRTQETNLGNFVTDIMLSTTKADVALLNSGTFRTDAVIPAGEFKKRDLMAMLPFIDALLVLQITGEQIWEALENGVSQHPKKEGRFPQISGVQFGYHPTAIPGQRVDPFTILVDSQHILPRKLYRICTKQYLAEGKDGYDVFRQCPVLVDEEEGPILSTIVQNHFTAVDMVKGIKPCRSGHRQSLISLTKRHNFLDRAGLEQAEQAQSSIAPSLEGRIYHMDDKDASDVQRHREKFLSATDEQLIEEMHYWDENNNYVEKIQQKGGYAHHDICTIPEVTVSSPDIKLQTKTNDTSDKPCIAASSASTGIIAEAMERPPFPQVGQTSATRCHTLSEELGNGIPSCPTNFGAFQERCSSPEWLPSKSHISDGEVTLFGSSNSIKEKTDVFDVKSLMSNKKRCEGSSSDDKVLKTIPTELKMNEDEAVLTQDQAFSPDDELLKTPPTEGEAIFTQDKDFSPDLLKATRDKLGMHNNLVSRSDGLGSVPAWTSPQDAVLHDCRENHAVPSTLSNSMSDKDLIKNGIHPSLDSISGVEANSCNNSCHLSSTPARERTYIQEPIDMSDVDEEQCGIPIVRSGTTMSDDLEGSEESTRQPYQQETDWDRAHAIDKYCNTRSANDRQISNLVVDPLSVSEHGSANERQISGPVVDPLSVSVHGLEQEVDEQVLL